MNIQSVLVIGAGTMGRGIAQWFAQNNTNVELIDNTYDFALKSQELIHISWEKLEQKGKFNSADIEKFKQNLKICKRDEISKNCDLVIEAIFEDLEIKKELFLSLDKSMNENTIFASNTSSFPISSLCKDLSKSRRTKFLGLHFFNPATIMKLVEVIPGNWTDQKVCKDIYDWFDSNGKKPALCIDTPGFIVNRVARNFYGESFRIAAKDDPKKYEEIDRVMKSVGGFKMGPFELMDLIGIDINFNVTQSVWNAYFNEDRFAPHPLQKKMVDSGRFGKKTKEGFYKYE